MVQGESGVGKTILINNLAKEIHSRKIVDTLQQASLLEVDTSVLLSGASYKGEVEDRLQSIFNEAKNLVKPILFVDDFHVLLQDASASQGILNVIKSELNKGEVILIGATTADNYRKHIANDDGLNRRFESVTVEEPDSEMAFRILKSVGQTYTEHHTLDINDEALRESIRLSKRYLKEKSLPDSALDLVDRTMAAANVSTQSLPTDLEDLNAKIIEIESEAEKQQESDKIQAIDWVYIELKNRLSPIVTGKFDTEDSLRLPTYLKKISLYKKDTIRHRSSFKRRPNSCN
ncbi:AAA family ATPase [Zobellia nedashkovskayae]